MKKNIQSLFFLFSLLLLITSCKTKQEAAKVDLSPKHKIVFLDSVAASRAIIQDEAEGFFEKIRPLEMQIQMESTRGYDDRTTLLADYKSFLQQDVADFTDGEKAYVSEVMQEAFAMMQKVNPALFPEQIRLVKTKANHYGQSVYYTREDMIVIPYDVLARPVRSMFLHVMLHEISHIYTRYNKEKRLALYELIGFTPLGVRPILPEPLQRRLLFNPDGVNFNYYMELTTPDGREIKAMPLLVSAYNEFSSTRAAFFDYIKFDMYELQYEANNSYTVVTDEEGFSTLSLDNLPDFFRQIKDNTGYIIHPDEIIADNFTYVIEAAQKDYDFKKYSKEGQILLEQIRMVLSE